MTVIRQVGGFVLAGGKSSRMGRDKAMLELSGESLVARAARLLRSVVGQPTIIGSPSLYGSLRLPLVADDRPGCGPLGGIATALRVSHAPWNLVIACDLPYLTTAWLDFLILQALESKGEAVVPIHEHGAEPLCALYHKNAEQGIQSALEGGVRKLTDALASLRVDYVEPDKWKGFASDGLLFKNVNSPADYEEVRARLSAHAKL